MATNPTRVYTYDILDMETPIPPSRGQSPNNVLSKETKSDDEKQDGGTSESQCKKIILVDTAETRFQVQKDQNWSDSANFEFFDC